MKRSPVNGTFQGASYLTGQTPKGSLVNAGLEKTPNPFCTPPPFDCFSAVFHSYPVWVACWFPGLSWNWGKENGKRASQSAINLTTVLTKIQLFFLLNGLWIIGNLWLISRFLKRLILTVHPVFLLLMWRNQILKFFTLGSRIAYLWGLLF